MSRWARARRLSILSWRLHSSEQKHDPRATLFSEIWDLQRTQKRSICDIEFRLEARRSGNPGPFFQESKFTHPYPPDSPSVSLSNQALFLCEHKKARLSVNANLSFLREIGGAVMGQTDRAGRPELRGRGWYSHDGAAPFSYLHGSSAAQNEIQNHDCRRVKDRSPRKARAKAKGVGESAHPLPPSDLNSPGPARRSLKRGKARPCRAGEAVSIKPPTGDHRSMGPQLAVKITQENMDRIIKGCLIEDAPVEIVEAWAEKAEQSSAINEKGLHPQETEDQSDSAQSSDAYRANIRFRVQKSCPRRSHISLASPPPWFGLIPDALLVVM
jgi:hypothetical protein